MCQKSKPVKPHSVSRFEESDFLILSKINKLKKIKMLKRKLQTNIGIVLIEMKFLVMFADSFKYPVQVSVKTCLPGKMDRKDKTTGERQGAVFRRQSRGDILRRPSQGDVLWRSNQEDVARRPSQEDVVRIPNRVDVSRKPSQGDTLRRQSQGFWFGLGTSS